MRPLFIDTGYLLALELANDQNHAAAKWISPVTWPIGWISVAHLMADWELAVNGQPPFPIDPLR